MRYLLIALALVLGGCTIQKGVEEVRHYNFDITFNMSGDSTATLEAPLDVISKDETQMDQDSKQDIPVDGKFALSQANQGATAASKLGAGLQALKDLKNLNQPDSSTTDTENIIKPETGIPELELTDSAKSEVIELRVFENKSFNWLPETGAYYGKDIRFVFDNDCGELLVPDGSVTHGADGSPNNHQQAFYFCGTDFPEGSGENNGNRASVFTAPGCVAETVTIYYTKD